MAAVNLIGSYNYALVALSVLIAMFASYAALDLAGRVTAASGWTRAVWLLGGAGAMGTGIWSMHYIGMLAFMLPIPVAYHWPTVLLSLFAAIVASVIALYVVSRQKMGTSRAVAASVLMGAGIASMHYIGMDAMRLPAVCGFDSFLVVESVVLAVLISFAALWISFHFRDEKTGIGWEKLAGAVVMGAAIPVMHYTGMAAASFTPSGMQADLSHAVSVSTLGTAGIAAVTFIVLGLALLTSWVDRRFAAQTFELERKRWRSLPEALPQLVWAATPDGACDYFSTQWTEYTGIPEAGLLGWRWMEVLHPDDREDTRQFWGDSVAGRRPYDVEYRVRRHDGAYGWFKTRGTPIRDSEGRIMKWFGTCTDITDRKRAEEALYHSEQALRRARDELEVKVAERTAELQRSEAYLAEAQTLSRTGSFGWHVSSGAIFWSEETFRIFEYDRAVKPTIEIILRAAHPEDVALVEQTIARASQDGKDFSHEYRLLMPDGRVKHVDVVAHASRDAAGNLEFVGAVMDITERKRAEEAQRAQEREREEMQRQLQQAAKMEAIGRLAGGIAHDFNNILGAILGYGELAQKHLEGRAARRHVDQVMQAGARGKGLVERILAFSRSGLGERVPVHVQSVVEETLEILAASLLPQVRLEKRLDAGDTAVVGDATQLHQVAMNLCTNALQAMEHGGVLTVVLDRESVPERRLLSHGTLLPGPYVRLSVSDTGSGIPPAVLERMFDPFFTTKGVGEGTGLGLSLVHGIVADFAGAIDVATQAGVGTTFTVWLPASGETPRLLAEPVGELPLGNGETVMIVDDQRSLVALAEETLAELGYEPAGFDSSVAALEAFRADPQRFDLVLTDETMPDLSGVELVREVRRVRPELPIVLMSGYSGARLTERARAAGVAELLRKPLVRRDIAEALARALRPSGDSS
jgi:PAS domain S-box-containing protein